MLYSGLHLVNEEKELSFHVCHMSVCKRWFAVADMKKALSAANPPKPRVMHKSDIAEWISKYNLQKQKYTLPAAMTFSDDALRKLKRLKWIKKRDDKWERVSLLCTETLLNQYLYGDGVSRQIDELIENSSSWTSRGAFYNALNRFITYGCTKNALLPFSLKHVGSNYRHFDEPDVKTVKRGRGKADNSESRSKTRGITTKDKRNILKVLRKMKGKFTLKMAHEKYQDTYERTELHRQFGGEKVIHFHPHPPEECISFQQFQYHLKKQVNPERILKKRVGHLSFEKDYKAKQGSSLDGVLGATHRYEIDATVLDLYVRYPYDKTGRLTMGRPVLYIVVDVFSTMITGFYLGFDGPNWAGATQALVNACLDKVKFAEKYGEVIEASDWPAKHIPSQITIDNGSEYPNSLIRTVLKSELGVQAFNFTAIYRGDAKGTVEGSFNVLNNEFVHHQPGAIFKDIDRGEQHPSNRSLYTYEEVVRKLIHQIIYHNNSADRIKKFSWQAVFDDIDVTPQALFLHSLETEMEGGRPSAYEDVASIHWGFLPEEKATVQKDGLRFRGVMYDSVDAAKRGFFSEVVHTGRYQIDIKRAHQSCDHLWHKTPDGEYIRFDLKNVNNGSPFWGATWEMADHLVEYLKQKSFDAQEVRRYQKAKRDTANARITRQAYQDVQGTPISGRKSMQPGISERQQHQKTINQQRDAEELRRSLEKMDSDYSFLEEDGLIDFDEEFFG